MQQQCFFGHDVSAAYATLVECRMYASASPRITSDREYKRG